jgi:hypothetical protein
VTGTDTPPPIIADTIVAVPAQIRAVATWFSNCLTDSQGLFTIATTLLTDSSAYGYTPLNYDVAAAAAAQKTSASAVDSGIRPGWCTADPTYWPTASDLKTAVDHQLLNLYTRLVEDRDADITTSIWQLFNQLSQTLTSIADDYEKGSDRIVADLNDLSAKINASVDEGSS